MVSLILTCWKRFDNFEKIINVWLNEKEIDEIIVWDNLGEFKTTLPITVINSNYNFGSSVRYALGTLVKNEIVLFADDDIMPQKGITTDFLAHFKSNRLLGVTGRIFQGSYANHTLVDFTKTNKLIRVDFLVGYLMMMHRDNLLGFNYRNAPWYCCELELEGKLKERDVELYVVPTSKWEMLPEGSDKNALYLAEGAAKEKEEVWAKYFKGVTNAK